MGLTSFALTRNRVMAVMLVVIAGLGVSSYNDMARDDMPPFTIRAASIVTPFPGASPERVEALVTDPIEKIAQEIPEVDNISSESRTGLSIVSVQLQQWVNEEDLQPIWDRLRRKLETARGELPDSARDPLLKDEGIGTVYGIVIGLTNDGYSYDELYDVAEDLRNEILALPDASEVRIAGTQEPQVFIDYNPARLAELGLSASRLQGLIASTNILYSGGSVALASERIILEPTGNYRTLDDLRATLISLPGGATVALGDITSISRGFKSPRTRLVRINGQVGLSLSVALREGANLIELGRAIDALLDEKRSDIPLGIEFVRVASQDRVVARSVDDFVSNLLQSVTVVFAVMLLMLGLRTGLVVASLIPMAVLLTFGLMDVLEVGLNKVTLAALIMALGMLVDNAIVISEAILVGVAAGKQADSAAREAARELAVPLLVSSMTTSAAFLAFFLAESTMGEIVGSLFVVISLALLASWLLSLTMIPMLVVVALARTAEQRGQSPGQSSSQSSGQASEQSSEGRVMRGLRAAYRPLIRFSLRQRALVIGMTVVLFVGSLASFSSLPFIFFPDSDRNLVTVDVTLPLGTRIATTEDTIARLEEHIRTQLWADSVQGGVTSMTSFVGEGPPSYDLGYQPGEANANYGHLLLNTSSGAANQRIIDAVNQFAIDALPDAQVKAALLAGGGGGVPIQVRLSGPAPAVLYRLAEATRLRLDTIASARNVTENWGPRIKKFVVRVEQANAQRAGLSNQDIAVSLQTVLTGFQTGEFRERSESVPIIMRAAESSDYTIDQVANTTIHAQQSGVGVPLSQVAEVDLSWQYPRIRRRDLRRTVTVEAYLAGGYTASEVMDELLPWLRAQSANWPRGYSYELGGENERSSKGMRSVAEKLPLAGAIILLLLVWQFNSLRKTFIVLCTIPLGLIGVIVGLHVFRSFFGFFGFLGIISLAGIVINNAIVLLDRIRIEIEDEGRSPYDAIVVACGHRLRPILLTTMTTTLGLIPLYLGGGAMWEPMAVSIMVGLLFGTLITLVLVPVLYSLLFRVGKRSSVADEPELEVDESEPEADEPAPEADEPAPEADEPAPEADEPDRG